MRSARILLMTLLTPANSERNLRRAKMSTKKVASQGGILEGMNPTKYNLKDPLQLFIIQVGLASRLSLVAGAVI